MGPKKASSKGNKASSSAAVPAADPKALATAQNKYRTAVKEKNKLHHWISSDLRTEGQFINKLVRVRVLLDNTKQIQEELKDKKDAYGQLLQAVYSSLPRDVQTGSSTADAGGRLSLSMLTARLELIVLLINAKVSPSVQVLEAELQHACQLLQKGFKKDSWQKQYLDPRSEDVAEKKKDQPAAAAAAELFEQLGKAYEKARLSAYVHLKEQPEAAADVLNQLHKVADLLKSSEAELKAAKAPQAKAPEQVSKPQPVQKSEKLQKQHVQQQLLQQDNSRDQQRIAKAARDAARSRDVKRGKELPEDSKAQQAYEQARQQEEQNAKEAAKVFEFLQGKVLGDGMSPEEHMQKMQSHTTVGLDALKKIAKELAAGKDKEPLPLQQCKQQMGSADPPQDALTAQLRALQNDKIWCVYLDEAAGQGKAGKQLTWSSWSEFEEHVVSTYLQSEVAELPRAADGAPDMVATYHKAEQLNEQLADEAADRVRQGQADENNPWVQAFGEECPLSRFLRTYTHLSNEEHFCITESTELGDGEDEETKLHRLRSAIGFALLQLQRKQMAVDRRELSYKPDWVVLAYHTLRLLPCFHLWRGVDESTVYNIYQFWRARQACRVEFHRVLCPHQLQETAPANGSSSVEQQASFTDGLAADNVTMLQMLHADQLLDGPLLLAVQLFVQRATGEGLDVSTAQGRQLNTADAEAVLCQLQERQQLELRQFLLEVLQYLGPHLTVYKEFDRAVQQQRVMPDSVPVVVVVNSQKEGPKLTLSREYYEQACLTAAASLPAYAGCCDKHHKEMLLAEADGRIWRKFDPDVSYEDFDCIDSPVLMDEQNTQRYLLQPARMAQAQQEKQLKVGTREGLKILVDKLFAVEAHAPISKATTSQVEQVDPRTTWDKVRLDLTLAAQLAVHRAELARLIEQDAHDLENNDMDKKQLQDRMRALLAQRAAGSIWQLRVWLWFYERQIKHFRKEESSIQEQLRQLQDAVEKEKPAKGINMNKADSKEKEEKLQQRQNQVINSIHTCENALAVVKSQHSRVMSDAQGYPDLLRNYYSVETGQANAITTMFSVLTNELLAPSNSGIDAARAQLQDALRLARLTLFDMDVWVMGHVLTARRRVLSSMWGNRQMAVLLSLSVEALKQSLKESISKSAEEELLLLELEEAKDSNKQQHGKAAGKKKKKKGGAKPAEKSHMQKLIAVADDSEDEDDAAAKIAEEEARQEELDEQQQAEASQTDAWPHTPRVDISKLGWTAHAEDEEEQEEEEEQQQWQQASKKESSGSSRDSRARVGSNGSQAASESAAAGKPGREAAGRGAALRTAPGSAGQRTAGPGAKQQQQDREELFYWAPVCSSCGDVGHKAADCTVPFCDMCNKHGHAQGCCHDACEECGRRHPVSGTGRFPCCMCYTCGLFGHQREQCPNQQCFRCGRYGHFARDCRVAMCSKCMQEGHVPADCPGYCQKCKVAGHDTRNCRVSVCAMCGQPGHTVGSPDCPKHSSSSTTAAADPPPPAAAGERSSSRQAKGQQGSAAAAASGASKQPAAPKQALMPGNVKLLSAGNAQNRNSIIDRIMEGYSDYATSLFDQSEKLDVLCRISEADMTSILKQRAPVAFLDEVYNCYLKTRSGSKTPQQLSAAACEVFKQALSPRLREALPDNWATYAAWAALEARIARGLPSDSWGDSEKMQFVQARKRAVDALIAADAAAGQQPSQQQRSGSRERLSSTGSAERPSSNGGGTTQQQQQQQPPPPPPAAPAAPARVSFKQAAHEQQPQVETMDRQGPAAVSVPPGSVSQHPGHQQEQQQYPQALMPPSSLYTMPPQPAPGHVFPAPEQLQQHTGAPPPLPPAPGVLPVDAFHGPLAPWMLCHHTGAMRAVDELQDVEARRKLMDIIHRAEPQQVLDKLTKGLEEILRPIKQHSNAPADSRLMDLAVLVAEAKKSGPWPPTPEPSPMPMPAAAVPGLLPHLQQQRGGSTYGVAANVLPPHLQQMHQPQQPPMWNTPPAMQQQVPAADDDEDDIDEVELLGLLTSSGTNTAQQQQQPRAGWNMQPAAAQQQGAGNYNPDFPMLGDEDGMQQAVAASLQGQNTGATSRRLAVSAAGLANEAGEYNCFLNVVVQCLWSCRDFRTQVWELPAATVAENAVVLALKRLFVQMQQAEAGWQPGEDRAVVNPTELREALDSATHFRRQEMNDANELLDTLYECFKTAQPPSESSRGSRGVLIDAVFGLAVSEHVHCSICNKDTHKVATHWEHMLVVNTLGLQFAAMTISEGNPAALDMSRLLRTLFDQEQKMCDKDEGGCGRPYPPARKCEQAPKVLTLQLVWDQTVTGEDIGQALQYVQETIDINMLYEAGCMATETTYKLSSAVAYYGQHYMAFVYNTKLEAWLLFDDASISQVGDWQAVIRKCVSGKIQPSVLFYQTVDIASVGVGGVPPPLRMHHPPPAAALPAMPPHMQPGGGGHSALPPHMQQGLHGAMGGPPPQLQPMPVAAAGGPPMGWPPQHMQIPPQQQQQQHLPVAAASRPELDPTRDGQPPSAYTGGWNAPLPVHGHDAWGAQPGTAPAAGPGRGPGPAAKQQQQQQPARPPGLAWGGAGMPSRIANQALKDVIGPAAASGRGRGTAGPRTASAPAPGAGRGQGPDPSRGRGRS